MNFRSWSPNKLKQYNDWKKLAKTATHNNYFTCELPELYEQLTQSLKFAMPNTYLIEVRRMTMQSMIEWNAGRPFDTVIRDVCLKPAIAFIECAFKLIADCAYDPKENYFYRGNRGALVKDHSDFNYLNEVVELAKPNDTPEQSAIRDEVRQFLTAIEGHERDAKLSASLKTTTIPIDACINLSQYP